MMSNYLTFSNMMSDLIIGVNQLVWCSTSWLG